MEMKVPGPHGVTYVAGLQPVPSLKVDRKSKKPLGDQTVVAYWSVRRVQDKSMANMCKATMPCTMTIDARGDAVAHASCVSSNVAEYKALEGRRRIAFS